MESSLSYLFRSLSSFDEVLSCIFSGIDAGVIVADKDRKMVLVNDTALELFGYSEAELIGQSTQILYLDPESFHHQGKQHFMLQPVHYLAKKAV